MQQISGTGFGYGTSLLVVFPSKPRPEVHATFRAGTKALGEEDVKEERKII
jgi:hypothetical protein